ncbi:MAG: DUF748 domain-containing protein [Gammaproteobacteria bacterium]|jgi:hypothetical protein|nr:DUF748 domain-containing protein [Gammaproteobacteria bacterium]
MTQTVFTDWHSWLSPRRKRFWLVALLGAYTLIGFVVVPWALQAQLPALAQDYLKRDAQVAKITFNPWLLRLQAADLKILDTDGSPLLELDGLEVNLQTRSLVRLALVFREIKLTGPHFNIVRRRFGDSNVGDWVNDLTAADPTEPAPAEAGDMLRLIIDQLRISDASVDVVDQLPQTPFATTLGPINISLDNLSTLPNEAGEQQVLITTESGAELRWSGSLQITPLVSAGTLQVEGSPLGAAHRYFSDQLNFSFADCCLDISLRYALEATPDGGVTVAIDDAQLALQEIVLRDLDDDSVILQVPELRVNGGTLRWPAATAALASIEVNGPTLSAWLTDSGTLNLAQLVRPTPAEAAAPAAEVPAATTETTAADSGWDISVGALSINDMQVGLADRRLTPAGQINVDSLNVRVSDISNQPAQQIPFTVAATLAGGGAVTLKGAATAVPDTGLSAELGIAGLDLRQFEPWVQTAARVAVDSGRIDLSGTLDSGAAETLQLRGDLQVRELEVSDTLENERLVGWTELAFDDLRLALDAGVIELSAVELKQPFARLIIDEQGATNFAELAVADVPAAAEEEPLTDPAAEPAAAFIVRVGASRITDGAMDFSDLALPLPFRAQISQLEGTLSALASDSRQASKLALEGQVGEFGLASIDGNLNVLDPTRQADIELRFRNVNMPDLSPYSAKFAGQKIDSGKLDLTLDYVFDQRLMQGDNQMVLKDFELGEKVDSPEALDLPLGLAVALLRDVNGKIDLQLGVSGDLDDPEFSASGIILKTFANLITKAVAAPFKLLGGLLPGGADVELDSVLFRAGRADLAPPEQEKIALLSDALLKRPGLLLEVAGGFNRELDVPALQAAAVEAQLAAQLGAAAAEAPAAEQEQLLRKTRRALEQLATAQELLGDLSLRDLQAQFTAADPDDEGAQRFDEVAYMAELRTRLESAQAVTDAELDTLATARAATIRTALGARQLDPARVAEGAPAAAESTADGWVSVKLGLEAGAAAPAAEATG